MYKLIKLKKMRGDFMEIFREGRQIEIQDVNVYNVGCGCEYCECSCDSDTFLPEEH